MGVEAKILSDGFHDTFDIAENLVVPESQDTITLCRQVPRAIDIAGIVGVLTAIHLHDQLCLPAAEISDKGSDGELPAEMCVFELMVAQPVPQCLLRLRHIPAQAARSRNRGVCSARHFGKVIIEGIRR